MKKKVCKSCGRNRRLGKFGQMSCYSDGKNIYCRDCMRIKRKRYLCTSVGMEKQRECVTKWKKTNKERIKEYNHDYYKRNKERIKYNLKSKKDTECVLIEEDTQKSNKKRINKDREICIVINPKRK